MADFKGFHKTAMGQNKMKLRSHRWGDTWKRGSLEVEMMGNNPRITVWPRNPEEEGKMLNGALLEKTPIVASMDLLEHLKFLRYFERMILNGKPCKMGYNSKKQKEGSEDKFEKEIRTKVTYGVDLDGKPFISVRTKDRAAVTFGFEPNIWSEIIDENGEPMDPVKHAIDDALTWIEAQRLMFGAINVMVYDPELQNGFGDKPVNGDAKKWNDKPTTYSRPKQDEPQQDVFVNVPDEPKQPAASPVNDSWD